LLAITASKHANEHAFVASGEVAVHRDVALPETGSSLSVKWFAKCCFSGTRKRRLCRVFFFMLGKEALCRVFFLALGKEALCRVFFFTLGKENLKAHFKAVN